MNVAKKILFYSSIFFLFLSIVMFLANDAEAQNLIKSGLTKDNYIIFGDNFYSKLFNDKIPDIAKEDKENKNDIIISEEEDLILDEKENGNEIKSENQNEEVILKKIEENNIISKNNNNFNSNINSVQNSQTKTNDQKISEENNKGNIKENKNNINNNTNNSNYNKNDNKITESKTIKKENIQNLEKYNYEKEIIETIYKGGFFTIQIASFKSFNNAINLRNYFVERGYISFVIIKKIDNIYFFRVNIGIFMKKEDALNYYKKLKLDKSFRPFVIYYPKNYF